MKKKTLLMALLITIASVQCTALPSFVKQKNKNSEKPTAVKEEIASLLKDILTTLVDLLPLISDQEHLIMYTMEELIRGEGQFLDPTVKALQEQRDELKKCLSETQAVLQLFDSHCCYFQKNVNKATKKG